MNDLEQNRAQLTKEFAERPQSFSQIVVQYLDGSMRFAPRLNVRTTHKAQRDESAAQRDCSKHSEIAAQHSEIAAQHSEMKAQHNEIAAQHSEIAAQ